jgi:multidrug transporter EmrE-like cation transporter
MELLKGFIFGVLAQVITFLQLQGQLKFDWIKNNMWFGVLMGLPISFLFMLSVKNLVGAFDGQIWPSRLIGFGIGVVVFTIMSHYIFKEPLTPKTLVCLGLGILIVLIQIFYK